MSRQRLICDGLCVGRFWLPPFEVSAGDFIKLETPNNGRVPWQEVLDLLGHPSKDGPIRAPGRVIAVDWPRPRSAFLELFHRQRTIEWFCKQTGLTRTEALPWLERVGLPPDEPLCAQAGNPKKLMSIQAALALKADVIVFDTAGVDFTGLRRIATAVSEQLGDSAAICVSWLDESQFLPFQFSSVYAVTEQTPQPASS